MPETINSAASSLHNGEGQHIVGNDVKVNTDNLSPEATRRFERFAGLVASFEKAASSGAISPPPSDARSEH